MKTLLAPYLFLSLALPAVSQSSPSDAAFENLANTYIDGYFAWRPLSAVALGLHQYDGKTSDLSRESREAEHRRLKKAAAELKSINRDLLSPGNAYDYRILQCAIESELFTFAEIQPLTRNPMNYAQAIDVNVYIKRNYAPLAERAKSVIATERAVPGILAAARENLDPVLPRPFVETAIRISEGAIEFLKRDLVAAMRELPDTAVKKEFEEANAEAISAYAGYIEWLKRERLPDADDRFALGASKFATFLRLSELVEQSPADILAWGRSELKREQERFRAAARIVDPAKDAIVVFKEIQKDHPTADGLLPDTRRHLEEIRQFVIERKIISLPSDVRVRVMETPQYARATSFASMDTPGPFEKSDEAFYYVTPTEKEWSKEKQEEWLSAFNYYTTDIVSIHEAYPGHYVQFLHLNASPATRIQKIFGSYAFVEGWAHYTEQMMLDEGFGADKDPVTAAKYRLAQSGEALLRLCRLCVAIEMHCHGMSVPDATKFFQEHCYYEQKPAEQEATRGTFDPGYLNYTMGKMEILKLRREYQEQQGANYSLQRFHDELVGHGMPPIALLRGILLK